MADGSRTARIRRWHAACFLSGMMKGIARLFTIKTKFEAFLVIYGLGAGAVERGIHYLDQYPGTFGRVLFGACCIVVFMAGDRILDSVDRQAAEE